jgi:hypothetical protein
MFVPGVERRMGRGHIRETKGHLREEADVDAEDHASSEGIDNYSFGCVSMLYKK